MKNKKLIRTLLYVNCVLFMLDSINAQVILQSSAVKVESSNYIDFEPGYWVQKGTVFTATISTESFNCSNSNLTENAHGSNHVDINIKQTETLASSKKLSAINIPNKRAGNSYVEVFPNPFSDEITIELDLESNSPIQIDLFNVQGKLLRNISSLENIDKGKRTISVDVNDLKKGIYFIYVRSALFVKSIKIIK